MRRTPFPHPLLASLLLTVAAASLSPGPARADVAGPPLPGDFQDCTASYREKGDTTCVECDIQGFAGDDDDTTAGTTCADEYADTEFFYVCSRFEYGRDIEVWCDGPHKADCACTVASGPAPWTGVAMLALGAIGLLIARGRRRHAS